MLTLYQKLCLIREEHFQDLRNEKEKQYVDDMAEGLDGVPANINDEDVMEYLTPRQVVWIKDIWHSVS